ncbi:DUF433 domain-containing protein [Halalkalirubrum salinum]|uniref:DUF433 domain-containing protein n=1 Tax=Halalkalirubrum salinum TaxID=2563889 RepID=UPI0010FB313C|nr:DUF433 domain-containing protein [Halalkalirubrum salinum]
MVEIVATEDVLGGEPRIAETRIGVFDVYELVGSGCSPADVADQLDRTLAEVYTALAYYHEHSTEMRELRRDRARTKERLAETALAPPTPAQ